MRREYSSSMSWLRRLTIARSEAKATLKQLGVDVRDRQEREEEDGVQRRPDDRVELAVPKVGVLHEDLADEGPRVPLAAAVGHERARKLREEALAGDADDHRDEQILLGRAADGRRRRQRPAMRR